jgi:hypothetical protein
MVWSIKTEGSLKIGFSTRKKDDTCSLVQYHTDSSLSTRFCVKIANKQHGT